MTGFHANANSAAYTRMYESPSATQSAATLPISALATQSTDTLHGLLPSPLTPKRGRLVHLDGAAYLTTPVSPADPGGINSPDATSEYPAHTLNVGSSTRVIKGATVVLVPDDVQAPPAYSES